MSRRRPRRGGRTRNGQRDDGKAEPGRGTIPSLSNAEEDTSAQTLKVLLVDDEEDFVRTMAERMEMRDLGSEVASGRSAGARRCSRTTSRT